MAKRPTRKTTDARPVVTPFDVEAWISEEERAQPGFAAAVERERQAEDASPSKVRRSSVARKRKTARSTL